MQISDASPAKRAKLVRTLGACEGPRLFVWQIRRDNDGKLAYLRCARACRINSTYPYCDVVVCWQLEP